ncbi:MAG: deoxyuridine 5'-triphosphate nucleotidohydrolase [Candidatus Coatesbacteria bacterium]|nr:deoxyuridine 5'-triphosphate nucleotidohydrolase [Candidatus Coatesbacteria bacterium]
MSEPSFDSVFHPGPLPAAELRRLLAVDPPLLENLADAERQLTPNGVDLSLDEVARFSGDEPGVVDFDNGRRRLPAVEPLAWRGDRLELDPGSYLVRYAEKLNLPADVIALGKPRSSLLRCGVELASAVWDAGYAGRGQGLLIVRHPAGLVLYRRARLLHLVFFRLTAPTAGYAGTYQNEGA